MFTSKHNPAGSAHHCDNTRLEEAISRYQIQRDAESLGEIVELSQKRALALIRFYQSTKYRSEDELLSDINLKLMRSVDKFDPSKCTSKNPGFTFVSSVIWSALSTSVTSAKRNAQKYTQFDAALANRLPASVENRDGLDDLRHRIKASVKTTLSDESELATQKWYVDSFTAEGFDARRHECADAAMAVYGLSHARSRELYDLTMLEVRRVLYDDVKRRPHIAPGRLIGTRLGWIVGYAHLLTETEFTKLAVLMREIAPYVLLLLDRDNRENRRRDRSVSIGRKHLELVINGDPDAVPLFSEHRE
jgi:hypothetical protein